MEMYQAGVRHCRPPELKKLEPAEHRDIPEPSIRDLRIIKVQSRKLGRPLQMRQAITRDQPYG